MSKKQLVGVKVILASGTAEEWSREDDSLDRLELGDGNVVTLINEDGDIVAAYSPVYWLSFVKMYEDVDDERTS